MARKAKPLYTAPRFYYMAAYRARMKIIRQSWSRGKSDAFVRTQRDATLRWMWARMATREEREECERLFRVRSRENAFVADDASVPGVPVRDADPAPGDARVPAVRDGGGDDAGPHAGPDAGPVDEANDALLAERAAELPAGGTHVMANGPQVGAARGEMPVNTTRFHYMPAYADMNADLPELGERKLGTAQKRTLLEAGLGDPEREQDGKRWHGTHFLGSGATGNCSLWVRTNETDNIDERLAVRDIATMHQRHWVDPTNWRDRLPREIAIMRRLNEQGGPDNNIHRYFGHRIDMWKRRYRIYTEVCDLGNIESALEWYSRPWRRRRHLFKWQNWVNGRPDVVKARENREEYSPGAVDTIVQDTKNEVWGQYKEMKENNPDDHPSEEFDDMSDIEEWHNDELGPLPPVIPEAFLWHVFDQLAGAALIMQRGADPFVGGKKWKEIAHKDMHTGNIFMKPTVEGFFGSNRQPDPRDTDRKSFATFTKSEYPDVVLADFDTAIFNLQDGDDEYQDNPLHYMIDREESDDAQGGRYPPEAFWAYQHRPGWKELTQLTSATDVWGIGSIMWNLAMNLPHYAEYVAPFYDDTASHTGVSRFRRLNNGHAYSQADLGRFCMTGNTPFEASARYSAQLRQTIRRCLSYHPRERIKLKALKSMTAEWRQRYMDGQGAGDDLVVRVDGRVEGFKVGDVYVPLRE